MKIEDFEEYMNQNRKRKMDFGHLHEEFKSMGLENFLLLSYQEEQQIMGKVYTLLDQYRSKPINPKIVDLFNPVLDAIHIGLEEHDITMFFSYAPKKAYYLAIEVAKRAHLHIILPNIFDDDYSVNHMVRFKKNQHQEIQLMLSLIGHSGTDDGVAGFKIYGQDLSYIGQLASLDGGPIVYPTGNDRYNFCSFKCRRDNDPYEIKKTREVIGQIMANGIFESEVEMAFSMHDILMRSIHSLYEASGDTIRERFNTRPVGMPWLNEQYNHEQSKIRHENTVWLKAEKECIFNILVQENRIPVKWKSEKDLYDLIYSNYKDAIFQHRPQWLAPQSLDVFVPSLKAAFEYQGVQHYESIEFFGGVEALEHRMELDKKKKKLCDSNGIILVEWHYHDTVTKPVLIQKLRELGKLLT